MSPYRDSLPDDATRARFDAAIARAGTVFAAAIRDTALLAAAEGTRAVAEAAWYPGHRLTVEAIQARYEEQQEAARGKQAA